MDGTSWSITKGREPTGADRVALQERRRDLIFPPARPTQIGQAVSRLFLRFPSMKGATEDQVAAYTTDLVQFPAWAIAKGMANIISGYTTRHAEFCPPSPVVRDAVRKVMEPVWAEQAHIDAVLSAVLISGAPTPFDAPSRKAIADAARAMMRHNAPKDTRQPFDRSQLGGTFAAATYVPPADDAPVPKLSEEARIRMGLRGVGR